MISPGLPRSTTRKPKARHRAAKLAARTYVVLIDKETETKYRAASESTGIPIEELIAGGAAHQNRSNDYTETELDPEVVLWLIEASADVRLEKRKAGLA